MTASKKTRNKAYFSRSSIAMGVVRRLTIHRLQADLLNTIWTKDSKNAHELRLKGTAAMLFVRS